MSENFEGFTAETLRRYIVTPPVRSSLDEFPADGPPPGAPRGDSARRSAGPAPGNPGAAQTSRARRITEVLSQAASKSPAQSETPGPETHSARQHDAMIRKHLGELVRGMLAEGRKEDLAKILEDHHRFIDDILKLLHRSQQS